MQLIQAASRIKFGQLMFYICFGETTASHITSEQTISENLKYMKLQPSLLSIQFRKCVPSCIHSISRVCMCADSCVPDSYQERCVRQILSGNRYGLIISEKQGKTQIDIDFTNSGGDAEFVVKHKYPTGNRKLITSAGYQMPALPTNSKHNSSSTTRSRRFKS